MNSIILLAKINSLASQGGNTNMQELLKTLVSKEELSKELAKKANASSLSEKANKVHTHSTQDIIGLGNPLSDIEIDEIVNGALKK